MTLSRVQQFMTDCWLIDWGCFTYTSYMASGYMSGWSWLVGRYGCQTVIVFCFPASFCGTEECDENPQFRRATAAEIRTMYCPNQRWERFATYRKRNFVPCV